MKKGIVIGVAAVVLIGLLAGGAFTAVRLLASPDVQTADDSGGIRVMESVSAANGEAPVVVRTALLPAPELPQEQPAATGILNSREDNSLFVGTGSVEIDVRVEVDGAGQESVNVVPSTSGPELEVVIGRDTIIYKDVTDLTADMPTESGEREVTQQLERVDSIEDLPDNAEISAWGERRGDRVVADILVYGELGGGMFR